MHFKIGVSTKYTTPKASKQCASLEFIFLLKIKGWWYSSFNNNFEGKKKEKHFQLFDYSSVFHFIVDISLCSVLTKKKESANLFRIQVSLHHFEN